MMLALALRVGSVEYVLSVVDALSHTDKAGHLLETSIQRFHEFVNEQNDFDLIVPRAKVR